MSTPRDIHPLPRDHPSVRWVLGHSSQQHPRTTVLSSTPHPTLLQQPLEGQL